MPINFEWDRGIRESIESDLGEPVTIDIEYLDFLQLKNRDYREKWLELLRLKYGKLKPDMAIPVHEGLGVRGPMATAVGWMCLCPYRVLRGSNVGRNNLPTFDVAATPD